MGVFLVSFSEELTDFNSFVRSVASVTAAPLKTQPDVEHRIVAVLLVLVRIADYPRS